MANIIFFSTQFRNTVNQLRGYYAIFLVIVALYQTFQAGWRSALSWVAILAVDCMILTMMFVLGGVLTLWPCEWVTPQHGKQAAHSALNLAGTIVLFSVFNVFSWQDGFIAGVAAFLLMYAFFILFEDLFHGLVELIYMTRK